MPIDSYAFKRLFNKVHILGLKTHQQFGKCILIMALTVKTLGKYLSALQILLNPVLSSQAL